jgi:hypothetical protein
MLPSSYFAKIGRRRVARESPFGKVALVKVLPDRR